MSTIPPARAALLHPATTPGCGKWTSALAQETCALTRAVVSKDAAPPASLANAAPPTVAATPTSKSD